MMKSIFYAFRVFFVIPFLFFVLPFVALVFDLIEFHELIYTLIGIGSIGIVYWLIKSKNKVVLRKKIYTLFTVSVICYAGICLFVCAFPKKYDECDKYTKML